jgi:ADP-ribose pyrophosphatase YjhB (NUDIX family)
VNRNLEASSSLAPYLEANAGKAQRDLPEDLFLLISRLVPMVNVDLLIKDSQNRTLLTWRDDEIYGAGWHLPGGVIRFREPAADRVREVARLELGVEVIFEPTPLWVAEIIDPARDTRGHAVSLLYSCALAGSLRETQEYRGGRPRVGAWQWHAHCPPDLLPFHRVYERFLLIRKKGKR